MGDDKSFSLINLGKLAKPADTLIQKVSEGIGGLAKPWQIRRVASAEADAKKTHAVAEIEIHSDIQERTLNRMLVEEERKQQNIEAITIGAIENLKEDSKPSNIENDWIANFFDKCKLVSDEEMQSLWSQVLAGEANTPGTFSKRTVNFVSNLDKQDAELFTKFSSFSLGPELDLPLIYNIEAEIYNNADINYTSLLHLQDLGLITLNDHTSFQVIVDAKRITSNYFNIPLIIDFQKEKENIFNRGHAVLTHTGKELATICGAEPIDGFINFLSNEWIKLGYKLTI